MIKQALVVAMAMGLVAGAATAAPPKGWKSYTDAKAGWSVSYPANFTVNTKFTPEGMDAPITGVSFSVPDSYTKGTNLNEGHISVETRAGKNCKAAQFVDPVEDERTIEADGRVYRSATSSDAGMSQYYATSLFIVDGTCLAVRYFTHSTATGVFDPPPKEFDAKKLDKLFDSIRATLTLRK